MNQAALVALSMLGGIAGSAAADSTKAESLFRQGRELMAAGRYAEACSAFDSSQKHDPSTTTLFNQADCREKNGQLATAWGLFVEAERQTRATSDVGAKLHKTAVDRAAKLESRLSKVTVSVPAPVDGLVVVRGNEPIERGEWNRALPIDGGSYTFTARVGNREVWRDTITVRNESDSRTVTVTIAAAPVEPARRTVPEGPANVGLVTAAAAPIEKRPFRFGGRFAINSATQAGFQRRAGIAIGAYAKVDVAPRMSLEAGASYSQKGAAFDARLLMPGDPDSYRLDYLEVPIVGVFSYPLSPTMRARGFGGPYIDFLVAAEGNLEATTKTVDFGLVLGGGIDVDLGRHTLVFDLRLEFGLTNTTTLVLNNGATADFKHNVVSLYGGYLF